MGMVALSWHQHESKWKRLAGHVDVGEYLGIGFVDFNVGDFIWLSRDVQIR